MTKNTIPRALKRQQTLAQQLEPLSVRIERQAAQRVIQPIGLDPSRELTRSLHGVIEELQRSVALDSTRALLSPLEKIRVIGAEFHKQFRLPKPVEFPKLLQSIERDTVSGLLAPHRKIDASLAEAMKAMKSPWLNMQDEIGSLTGIAGLNELGHLLQTTTTFDVAPAKRVRSLLGDWRKKIDWPAEIFTDPLARSEFYLDLGLEPTLTEFPAEAFHEALKTAGIKGGPPYPTEPYNRHDQHQDEEETGFERNNAAHDRLQRFESKIRDFISGQMECAFGENWVETRVPPETRKQWEDKRNTARTKGEPLQPPIAYADFTDYERIIVNKANWRDVFVQFFQRITSVQESLQRLYPIRVCTMHGRFITQDDELYLLAETQRLSRAMDQSGSPDSGTTQDD